MVAIQFLSRGGRGGVGDCHETGNTAEFVQLDRMDRVVWGGVEVGEKERTVGGNGNDCRGGGGVVADGGEAVYDSNSGHLDGGVVGMAAMAFGETGKKCRLLGQVGTGGGVSGGNEVFGLGMAGFSGGILCPRDRGDDDG